MRKMLLLPVAVAAIMALQPIGHLSALAQFSDLIAKHVTVVQAVLPGTATSNLATVSLSGTRSWDFFPENRSPSAVTNLSVTVDSGYSPSLFNWHGPVTSFPATHKLAKLRPGKVWDTGGPLSSTLHVRNFTTGYDSTRTVKPATIQAGGGKQTVTITVTPRDAQYATLTGFVIVGVASNLPGVTLDSWTNPSNLNHGETLSVTPNAPGLLMWQLAGAHLNTTYRFTATLDVPNAALKPITFRPEVRLRGSLEANLGEKTGTTVRIADPTLNGGTAGRGGSTFSVTETDHTWTLARDHSADVVYSGIPGQ